MLRPLPLAATLSFLLLPLATLPAAEPAGAKAHDHAHAHHIQFDVRSVRDGAWSEPKTWDPPKVPSAGSQRRRSPRRHASAAAAVMAMPVNAISTTP